MMNLKTKRVNGQGQMTKRKGQIGDIRAIEAAPGRRYFFILAGHTAGESVRVSEEHYRAALEAGYRGAGLRAHDCTNGRRRYTFSKRWVTYDEVGSIMAERLTRDLEAA